MSRPTLDGAPPSNPSPLPMSSGLGGVAGIPGGPECWNHWLADPDPLTRDWAARDPDVRLMLATRAGVPGAFERIVSHYQDRLLGIVAHLVGRGSGTSDETEDLVQEIFLRVHRARTSYTPRSKFSTWLFTIANHVVANHLRSKGRRPWVTASATTMAPTGVLASAPSREATPSTQLKRDELARVVQEALNELSEDQKLAVLLQKFEDLGYAEIAAILGKSEAAVKSLLARARRTLRERLQAYLDGD
ncbi:RNA polymerase, sigma-24 subunit, ECF subfamily [Isosphaera pallida ATCC 43644]|uniref:RNA polymerase, sigma-24 subunit, ECF subfamily n=1 Tax=Isosphaera pallida (strain ATCC 43644 / DSM 9630 / IS1B) TaxID=575540 RepID=E8QWA5_ISOPI|nr:sigma-70 family RNA polymerase sigma factor [Isosphaera pallida]ADV60792.1 RNA polymerase, sigma-24 subunit, ECF subfamily [Isosphaera pallida ATCC 43644]